ncbi:Fanconi anemia group F protein [Polymixia lowei]
MEAVLKNVERTSELLAVVNTDVVERWDKQTLDRAFQWARYCEHLHSRFHKNPAIRKLMEKQLQVTNDSLRTTFRGYAEVTFSDLSRCQHLLLVGLLRNPMLPRNIIKILFDSSGHLSTNVSECQDATGHCTQLIEYRSAYKVLKAIDVRSTSVLGADADVQGMMLVERLEALLCPGSEVGIAEHFMDTVLQSCEGVDYICLIIAAALMTRENNMAEENTSQDFLLNWLQQNNSLLHKMFSTLPTGHLIDLARQNMKFRVTYCNALKRWASDMEYDLNEGKWVPTGTDTGMSFKKLIDHFLMLFEACPSLRTDIEKEFDVLKISDGDFDVRGLSVWGDLLSELNK